jgi:hypothetical protein
MYTPGICILLEGEPILSLIIFFDSSLSKFFIIILGALINSVSISSFRPIASLAFVRLRAKVGRGRN